MVCRSLRRRSSFIGRDLVGELTQGGQVVFDFAVGSQSGLSVARNRLRVCRRSLPIDSGAGAEIQRGHSRGGPGGPKSDRGFEPRWRCSPFVTCGTAKDEHRKPRCSRDTYLGIRSGNGALGARDIRAPHQQGRGKTGGNRWRLAHKSTRIQREICRRLVEEHGNRMLELGTLQSHIHTLRACILSA
jgi:hypothetical protein